MAEIFNADASLRILVALPQEVVEVAMPFQFGRN